MLYIFCKICVCHVQARLLVPESPPLSISFNQIQTTPSLLKSLSTTQARFQVDLFSLLGGTQNGEDYCYYCCCWCPGLFMVRLGQGHSDIRNTSPYPPHAQNVPHKCLPWVPPGSNIPVPGPSPSRVDRAQAQFHNHYQYTMQYQLCSWFAVDTLESRPAPS